MGERPPDSRLTVRRMDERDIDAVTAVERVSFAHGWPPTAFQRELTANKLARYVVLESGAEQPRIIAFGGLWLQLDEAHVVTVAVHPDFRRSGYGLVVVRALLDLARNEGIDVATLEVRVSNHAARQLYRKCGFYEVGERKRYYTDNGEDAVIMTTESFDSAGFQRHYQRLAAEVANRFPALCSLVP